MQWGHWTGHMVLIASALLMIATALVFKLWHKYRRRRSPLGGRAGVGHLLDAGARVFQYLAIGAFQPEHAFDPLCIVIVEVAGKAVSERMEDKAVDHAGTGGL